MKFDFSAEPYFDDHTHLLFTKGMQVTEDQFAINYYHGIRDGKDEKGENVPSATAISHLPFQGVNMMLFHALSERFGCEPTLAGATAFRNAHTKTDEDIKAYTEMLFKDANVWGCMLDSELEMGDPKTKCFPCKTFRLFRYEEQFNQALKEEDTFKAMVDRILASLRRAKLEGYDGIKAHMGDRYNFDIRIVSDAEAEAAFGGAKAGNFTQKCTVYFAAFAYAMELAADLDLPIHLHTGTTGFKKRYGTYEIDPFRMVPFLKENPRFNRTKLVLIHASYPWTRHAAWMAYNFPNVYLDISQTQLWQGVSLPSILEDVMSCAPHDKIMMGSGQHWYCEMAWLGARTAKKALAVVAERLVDGGFFSADQAAESARMILCGNARKLYEK